MEKKTPHYTLSIIKEFIKAGKVRATKSAYENACAVGIDHLQGMCGVIEKLTSQHFYKSMTTHGDSRVWQDVYHGEIEHGDKVYLKLTVLEDVVIVSFKEL